MKRIFVISCIVFAFTMVIISCGPMQEMNNQFGIKKQMLRSIISISDMPTANHAAIFFAPEGIKIKKKWSKPIHRIKALSEWTRDYRSHYLARITLRPFFYAAEILFSSNERWWIMSRSADSDAANFGKYSNSGAYHEAEDWNRGSGYSDLGAPIVSPCDGIVMHKGYDGSFGNQIYVLCKFSAPWNSSSDGFSPLVEGFEFVAFKASHLQYLPSRRVGEKVKIGDKIGKLGGTGGKWAPHLHAGFHNESMLMRCNSQGKEDRNGNFICSRGNITTIWPTTSRAGSDQGFSYIRDHYYDPLQFIKSHSGTLLYSRRIESGSAQNSEMFSYRLQFNTSGRKTVMINLNYRDYPSKWTKALPPETRIVILNKDGDKQVFAGGESWTNRDKRAVLRNVDPSWIYQIKLEVRNHKDGKTTLSNAVFRFSITSYEYDAPSLGTYQHSNNPVVVSRSGLGTNLGIIYNNSRLGSTQDQINQLLHFNYLKTGYAHSILECQSRYECKENRKLTRCDMAKKIAVFKNYSFPTSCPVNPFHDLKVDSDCFPYAYALYQEKIVKLKESRVRGKFLFKPNEIANRATAVTIFVRALWGEPLSSTPSPFNDVPATAWYSKYFAKAYAEKIISGYKNGTGNVGPVNPMYESHMVIMLVRALGMNDDKRLVYSSARQSMGDSDGIGGGACSNCSCNEGDKTPCGTDNGQCKQGHYVCINGIWDTSKCIGSTEPSPEVCDGLDNDCDGKVDNIKGTVDLVSQSCELPECGTKGKRKCNNAKWGTCNAKTCTIGPNCKDEDSDGYGEGKDCIAKDCDDKNPKINPLQVEICNGIDDNCDGLIDMVAGKILKVKCSQSSCGNIGYKECQNGKWTTCTAEKCPAPCKDKDNDGYFSLDSGPHCPGKRDCNDSDPKINPGALEECDGLDNDCDGNIDNEKQNDSKPLTLFCYQVPCATKTPIHCHSGHWELCKPQNCPICLDKDKDGFKLGGPHCAPIDCDDNDKNIRKGAKELCNNKDDDCDGRTDNIVGTDNPITTSCVLSCGATGTKSCINGRWTSCEGGCKPCVDKDGDGYKKGGNHCGLQDCNDDPTDKNAKSINPGTQEICNGIDDDCDGFIDNVRGTSKTLKKTCTNPQCGSRGEQTCKNQKWSSCTAVCKCEDKDGDGFKVGGSHCGLQDCDDNDPNRTPYKPEVCDGKDNNCNGQVDEGVSCICKKGDTKQCYKGDKTKVNIGICRMGSKKCIATQSGNKWSECFGFIQARNEICDNQKDDDCDGKVDEGCICKPFTSQLCGSTIGECKKGRQTCNQSTHQWGPCVGATKPKPEVCDGKDNDCNGKVDDNLVKACYTGKLGTVGVGVCKKGVSFCINGKWSTTCLSEIQPSYEVCDNADNDCNGKVDDNLVKACYTGKLGTAGIGICKKGTKTCSAGKWTSCKGEGRPVKELCDGKDNDCDGFIDNKPNSNQRLNRACTRKPCNFQGFEFCVNGVWQPCTASKCPVQNTCKDSDGDGYYGYDPKLCPTGKDCNDNDSLIHPGHIEFCDGKDNNCNGKIDTDPQGKAITDICYFSCPNGTPVLGARVCDIKQKKWGSCLPKKPCPKCIDKDNDGYGINGANDCRVPGKKDCNDKDPKINPMGNDNQCDGKDNDCDGKVDNQKGTTKPLVGNCLVSPCNKPGTRTCNAGTWGKCTSKIPCEYCGNGFCNNVNENCATCPKDCKCPAGQSCDTTKKICTATCGNGKKDSGETCKTCPWDVKCPSGQSCNTSGICVPTCGNGRVDAGENCTTCPKDIKCPSSYRCQNGVCLCVPQCSGKQCGSNGCGGSCGACSYGKTCNTSTNQCESNCGNGKVDSGENCSNCPSDVKCSSPKVCQNGQCVTPQNPCGNGTCDNGETCSSCAKDCGCTWPMQCISGVCKKTCNCNSSQYCDNNVCKPYYTVQVVGSGCKTVNGLNLCLSASSDKCTSSGCKIEVRRSSGTWSGNSMALRFKNWYIPPKGCWQFLNVGQGEVPAGSSSPIIKTVSLNCLSVGSPVSFHVELISPSTCSSSYCTFDTGDIRITRNK